MVSTIFPSLIERKLDSGDKIDGELLKFDLTERDSLVICVIFANSCKTASLLNQRLVTQSTDI